MPLSMKEVNDLRKEFYLETDAKNHTVNRLLRLPAKPRKLLLLILQLDEKGKAVSYQNIDHEKVTLSLIHI